MKSKSKETVTKIEIPLPVISSTTTTTRVPVHIPSHDWALRQNFEGTESRAHPVSAEARLELAEKRALENPDAVLVLFNAALAALAKCHRVDEAKAVRDRMTAVRCYLIQIKNQDMAWLAAQIKLRAERRAGELLHEMAEKQERQTKDGVSTRDDTPLPTLEALGITRDQASAGQRIAGLEERAFEQAIAEKPIVTTRALAATAPKSPKRPKSPKQLAREKEKLAQEREEQKRAFLGHVASGIMTELVWDLHHPGDDSIKSHDALVEEVLKESQEEEVPLSLVLQQFAWEISVQSQALASLRAIMARLQQAAASAEE